MTVGARPRSSLLLANGSDLLPAIGVRFTA
jgi:hypothetical protein